MTNFIGLEPFWCWCLPWSSHWYSYQTWQWYIRVHPYF